MKCSGGWCFFRVWICMLEVWVCNINFGLKKKVLWLVCVGWFVVMFRVLKLWKLFLILGLDFIVKLSLLKKFLICLIVWVIGCKLLFLIWWLGSVILMVLVVNLVFSFVFCSVFLCLVSVFCIVFFVMLIFWLVVWCFFGGSLFRFCSWIVSLFFLFRYWICILFSVMSDFVVLIVEVVLVIIFCRCCIVFLFVN